MKNFLKKKKPMLKTDKEWKTKRSEIDLPLPSGYRAAKSFLNITIVKKSYDDKYLIECSEKMIWLANGVKTYLKVSGLVSKKDLVEFTKNMADALEYITK
jgi:hypothetical protein